LANPVRFFFLVAGYDYEAGGSENGLAFGLMCTGRVRERIVAINKTVGQKDALVTEDSTLRFIRFSFEWGKIEVIDREFVAGRGIKAVAVSEKDWKPLESVGTGDASDPVKFVSKGPFRAINRAEDYENLNAKYPNLKQGAATRDIMSIVDVYRSVRGAPEGGAILELSIFSHGWIDGPVLVNSSDRVRDPKLRDPDDKDGRAALDFNIFMGEPVEDGKIEPLTRLFRFMGSFNPKGVMRTWGCSYDIDSPVILQTHRQIKSGGATDGTVINFDLEVAKWSDRYRVADPNSLFFPGDLTKGQFKHTFREVKEYLLRRLTRSYAYQFFDGSRPLNLTAFGALPGTEGDDEKSGFYLMKVCQMKSVPKKKTPDNKLECPNGFAQEMDFYRQHIGVNIEDRGYGIFDAATVQKLDADLTAYLTADLAAVFDVDIP
jgi:hypothetical protein